MSRQLRVTVEDLETGKFYQTVGDTDGPVSMWESVLANLLYRIQGTNPYQSPDLFQEITPGNLFQEVTPE